HSIPPHLYWKNSAPPTKATERSSDNLDLFTRGDNGWADGLHFMDRFIKNTYQILPPLNELTAPIPMTPHEFLNSNRQTQKTVFGSGQDQVTVTVNLGNSDYSCASALGGEVLLPEFGFLAESPTFVAFHARNWAGLKYTSSPVFTLRSLDQRPLSKTRNIRV